MATVQPNDLRSHMEQVARDMSGIVLELRRRGRHVDADTVTRAHDDWVTDCAAILVAVAVDERERGAAE